MGSVPIQEFVRVDDVKKEYAKSVSELNLVIAQRNQELTAQKEFSNSLKLQFDSFVSCSSEDEIALKEQVKTIQNQLQLVLASVETKQARIDVLGVHINLLESLLKEEREALKNTQEMIYLRTGMKREVFPVQESEEKKERETVTRRPVTRSGIKQALEQRALRLIKEQQQKEDVHITKGEMPEEVH